MIEGDRENQRVNHSIIQIRTPEGENKSVKTCEVTPEDINQDGEIDYPPSGECNCYDGIGREEKCCPSCRMPQLGNQIVELHSPHSDMKAYAVVCSTCGTVYESEKAREQGTA